VNSGTQLLAESVDFTFSRQAILERSCTLWGSEIRVHTEHALHSLPAEPCPFYSEQLKDAYSEALRHTQPNSFVQKGKRLRVDKSPGLHKFFRIEQSLLMNEDLLNEIISTSNTLEKHKQQLIVSVENTLDTLPGPVERRNMIRQLYSLKDRSSLKLAYNNYTLDTKNTDLLIDLSLYDYIKMPFPDSALRLSLNTRSGLFDRLYDQMLGVMGTTRVSFIADNVEHADSALLARRLPFDYFQGPYFSPADSL
jgi:EAL domain-containing protein (putative c-di-GMP-specific phosphodiesterase class I)